MSAESDQSSTFEIGLPTYSMVPDVVTGVVAASAALGANFVYGAHLLDANKQAIDAAQKTSDQVQAKASFLANLYDSVNNPNTPYHLNAPTTSGKPVTPDADINREAANVKFNEQYDSLKNDPNVHKIIVSINIGKPLVETDVLIATATNNTVIQAQKADNHLTSLQTDPMPVLEIFGGTVIAFGMGVAVCRLSEKIRRKRHSARINELKTENLIREAEALTRIHSE